MKKNIEKIVDINNCNVAPVEQCDSSSSQLLENTLNVNEIVYCEVDVDPLTQVSTAVNKVPTPIIAVIQDHQSTPKV